MHNWIVNSYQEVVSGEARSVSEFFKEFRVRHNFYKLMLIENYLEIFEILEIYK
ncbi:hypothetical protein D8824_00700 [Streptococcus intermedius]|nr:hypothetical protein D8833_00690 [Streptococcus intermedius]RSJ17420.1 hypothetical protein D8831_00700 [Streptococcus intermedius]RSJ32595.1 hypothetical protein D8824_00700 [Streptococcus intermedius]